MAEIINDPQAIAELQQNKQVLEQTLVRNLYEVFDDDLVLSNLYIVIANGLREMRDGPDEARENAFREEGFLDVLQKANLPAENDTRAKTRRMIDSLPTFNASDCSDLIRLLGAWGEAMEQVTPTQKAYRPGVLAYAADQSSTGWAGEHWQEGAAAIWGKAYRVRGKTGRGLIPVEPHIQKGPSTRGGMEMKRAMSGSSILKIDRLFGLLVGADISGTTADSSFIVERWGSEQLHPYYYLLPAATIVYNFHHTLLEVALVLSLNKIIDYHIGFFATLAPAADMVTALPAHHPLHRIPDILNDAQNDERNRHFLCYYSEPSKEKAKALVFSLDEINRLALSRLTNGVEILSRIRQVSPFPTDVELVTLIKAIAPEIYPMLPLDLQAVKTLS